MDRLEKLCRNVVKLLNIDLTGLKIVTEAASGVYSTTPLIAYLAGAKEVICISKSTKYGSIQEISNRINNLASKWNLTAPIITENRNDIRLYGADIVTNLGFVRPIDESLLKLIGNQTVVPYMCEAWEIRPGDVDFQACKKYGIPVMGTNENDSKLRIFEQCGMLAVKMLLEAGLEVVGNRIAVLGSDKFGPVILDALNKCGSQAELFTCDNLYQDIECVEWDAIIVAEFNLKQIILGTTGLISGKRLIRTLRATPVVIQFAGQNEIGEIINEGSKVYPEARLDFHRMARTLADLGPNPAILLHAAGLLIGEKMARANKVGLIGQEFIEYVIHNSPAQVIHY